jgi:hypothetical protein
MGTVIQRWLPLSAFGSSHMTPKGYVWPHTLPPGKTAVLKTA